MRIRRKGNIKGVTLIELLAIIVLLAIISLIAVPTVTTVLENARIDTFKAKVKVTGQNVHEYLLKYKYTDFKKTGVTVEELSKIETNKFVSGKYIDRNGVLEAEYVTDGEYCAKGPLKDLRVNKHCYKLDDTAAEYDETKIHITTTTRSIKVVLDNDFAYDNESGIKEYRVSMLGPEGQKKEYKSSNPGEFVFDELKHDEDYTIIIEVVNGNDISGSFERTVRTSKITEPEIFVAHETEWKNSKVVTISGEVEGTTLKYKIENGETLKVDWTEIESGYNYTIDYTSNPTTPTYIYAQLTDGYNTVDATTRTQTMVDTDSPTIRLNGEIDVETSSITIPFITADTGGSGIKKVYCEYGTDESYGHTENMQVDLHECKITKLNKNETYYYRIIAEDIAGNLSTDGTADTEVSGSVSTADMLPPEIDIPNENEWKPAKQITITGVAPGAYLEYMIKNDNKTIVDWTRIDSGYKYTINYTSNEDKPTEIYARMVDGTNTVNADTKTQTMIDPEPPKIRQNGNVTTETSSITIPFITTDTGGSGIDRVVCEYGESTDYGTSSEDNAENITVTGNSCTITKLKKDHRYYFRIITYDAAGNPSTNSSTDKEVVGNIKTADMSPRPYIEIENELIWKKSKVVTFHGSAPGAWLQYRIKNGNTWKEGANSGEETDWITVSDGGTTLIDYTSNNEKRTEIYLRLYDGTNTEDAITKVQMYVDTEPPKIEEDGIASVETSTITIPIKTSDTGGSGVANVICEYGTDSNYGHTENTIITSTGCKITKLNKNTQYYYRVTVEDVAGNSSLEADDDREVVNSATTEDIPEPEITITNMDDEEYENGESVENIWMPSKKAVFTGSATGAHLEYRIKNNNKWVTGLENNECVNDCWVEVNNGGSVIMNYTSNDEKPTEIYLRLNDGTNTVNALSKTQTKIDPEPPTVVSNGTPQTETKRIIIPITTADTGGSGVDKVLCEYGEDNNYGNTSNVTTTPSECVITNLRHSKQYYYRIRVVDGAGNSSLDATSNKELTGTASTAVMNTPTIEVENENVWKNKKKVTFYGQSSGAHLEYMIKKVHSSNNVETVVNWTEVANGGTYELKTPSTEDQPTEIYLRITDGYNTVDAATHVQTLIDVEPPTVVANGPVETETSTIKIPVIANDTGGSGVDNLVCEYGTTTNYGSTANVEYDDNNAWCKITKLDHNTRYYYRVSVNDVAGNSSKDAENNKTVTGTAETVQMSVPHIEVENANIWKPSKIVTFTGEAAGAHLEYRIKNNNTWVTGLNESNMCVNDCWVEVNNGGTHNINYTSNTEKPTEIYLRITDGHNTLYAETEMQTMVDPEPPTIVSHGEPETETNKIIVPITAEDTGGSGVNQVICEYKKQGTSEWKSDNVSTSNTECRIVGLIKNTTYDYRIKVTDNAGNVSADAPTGYKEVTGTATTLDITIKPTITIKDADGNIASGVWKPIKYAYIEGTQPKGTHIEYMVKYDGSTEIDWTEYTENPSYIIDKLSVEGKTTEIYIRVTDGINTLDGETYVETKVDTIPPELALDGSITTDSSTATIPITVTEEHSGWAETICEYKLNSEPDSSYRKTNATGTIDGCHYTKLNHDSTYDYRITVKDNAGNVSTSCTPNGCGDKVSGSFITKLITTPEIIVQNAGVWKPSKEVTFYGIINESHSGYNGNGSHLEYKITKGRDENEVTIVDWTTVEHGGTHELNTPSTPDSPTYIYLRATDGTNIVNATTHTQTAIDIVPPTISLRGNVETETSTITIPFTALDTGGSGINQVICKYREVVASGAPENDFTSTNATVDSNNTYCKITGLTHNKQYEYVVSVVDGAGNVSSPNLSSTVTTIKIANSPTISYPNNDKNIWKPNKTVRFSGETPPNTDLYYRVVYGGIEIVPWTKIEGSTSTKTLDYVINRIVTNTNQMDLYLKVSDGTNTINAETDTQTKVDPIPPEVVADGVIIKTTSSATVPIAVTENESGWAETICEYKEHGAANSNYITTNTVGTETECQYKSLDHSKTFDYRITVKDNAGNLSTSCTGSGCGSEVTGTFSTEIIQTPKIYITNETIWKPSKTVTFLGTDEEHLNTYSTHGEHLEYRIKNGDNWIVGGNSGSSTDWVEITSGFQYNLAITSNSDKPTDIYLRAVDDHNVVNAETKRQILIDAEPPTIVSGGSVKTKTSKIRIPIVVTETGGSLLNSVICEWGEDSSLGHTENVVIDSNNTYCEISNLTKNKTYYYRVTAKDNAGNLSTQCTETGCGKQVSGSATTVDMNSAPTIAIENEYTWKSSKKVTLTGDVPAGARLEYRVLNGETWKVGSSSEWVTIGEESDWDTQGQVNPNNPVHREKEFNINYISTISTPTVVYLRITDGKNTIDATTKTQTMVDPIAPTIELNGVVSHQTSTITIPYTVADTGGSDIKRVICEYKLASEPDSAYRTTTVIDGETINNVNVNENRCYINGLVMNTEYTYKVFVEDNAGNLSTQCTGEGCGIITGNISTDNIPTPVIKITNMAGQEYENDEPVATLWKPGKKVEVSGQANGAVLQYRIRKTTPSGYTWVEGGENSWVTIPDNQQTITLEEEATQLYPVEIYLRLTDKNIGGPNTVDAITHSQTKIDRTAPTCGAWTGGSITWANQRTIYVACNETASGEASGCTQPKIGKLYNTQTVITDRPTMTISDNAGNTRQCTSSTDQNVYVDLTPPQVQADGELQDLKSNAVIVPISVTEEHSGWKATVCEYKFSSEPDSAYRTVSDDGVGVGSETRCSYEHLKKNTDYDYRITVLDNVDNSSTSASSNKSVTGSFKTTDFGGALITYEHPELESVWKPSKNVIFNFANAEDISKSYVNLEYKIVRGSTTLVDWTIAPDGKVYTIDFDSTASNPTYIYARVTDGDNVVMAETVTQVRVDATAPSCGTWTGGSTTWAKSRLVTVACDETASNDASGCVHQTYNKNYDFTIKKDFTQIWIDDIAGNRVQCTSPIERDIYVDVTPPKVSLQGSVDIKSSSITVPLSIDEDDSGWAETKCEYKLSSEPSSAYRTSHSSTAGDDVIVVPSQTSCSFRNLVKGTSYDYRITVKDIAGNSSTEGSTDTDVTGSATTDDFDEPHITISNNNTWKNSKTVTVYGVPSRGNQLEYRVKNGSTWKVGNASSWKYVGENGSISTTYTIDYESIPGNQTEIYARITDGYNTLNAVTATETKVDTTPPSCGTWSGESTNWATSRTIRLSCPETATTTSSGCVQSSYVAPTSASGTISTEDASVILYDNAGNQKTCNKKVNLYIDTEGPTCGSFSGEGTTWTKSRTLSVECTESFGSGCASNSFSSTYNSTSLGNTTVDTRTVSIDIKDNLNNSTTCSKANANLYVDNQGPTCGTWGGESTSWINSSRTITVGCTESFGSGCSQSRFNIATFNSGTTETAAVSNTISDNLGNTTTCSKTANVYVDAANYTASFNGNGGSNATPITSKFGVAYGTLPTNTSRVCYNFAGWYDATTGGTQVGTDWTMPRGGTTYYAHWNKKSDGWDGTAYCTSGSTPSDGWKEIDGCYYYFSGGRRVTGWQTWNGRKYYLHSDGCMAQGWTEISGSWYYFYAYNEYGLNGAMAYREYIDGWWLGNDGKWDGLSQSSWQYSDSACAWWYGYGSGSGQYASGSTYYIDTTPYTFDSNGYWNYSGGCSSGSSSTCHTTTTYVVRQAKFCTGAHQQAQPSLCGIVTNTSSNMCCKVTRLKCD